jgi:hypothetical protein
MTVQIHAIPFGMANAYLLKGVGCTSSFEWSRHSSPFP